MGQEVTLKELEEVVGAFKGISSNRFFTEIEVGSHSIALDSATPNTKAITAQLQRIGKGTKIGIIRIGGTLRVRRSEGNK